VTAGPQKQARSVRQSWVQRSPSATATRTSLRRVRGEGRCRCDPRHQWGAAYLDRNVDAPSPRMAGWSSIGDAGRRQGAKLNTSASYSSMRAGVIATAAAVTSPSAAPGGKSEIVAEGRRQRLADDRRRPRLRPIIGGRVSPSSRARAAHELLVSGEVSGKIVSCALRISTLAKRRQGRAPADRPSAVGRIVRKAPTVTAPANVV